MTDLVRPPVTDLGVFVEQARQVHAIATALSDTSFVPASMRGKPQEITGAILFGRALGMDPMTSLQTINIIQGRAALSANAMRGLAMAAGVQFRLDESTQTRCVMSALAPGQSKWTTVVWNIDQARALDLLKKDNWRNQPGVMLIARATSQLCRLVAANILIGAPYSAEEIRDHADKEPEEYLAPKPKPRPKAITQPPKFDEPELVPDNPVPDFTDNTNPPPKEIGYNIADDEKRIAPEVLPDVEGKITSTTRAGVMAAFTAANVKDRTLRNATISKILGREVHTVNNLTEDEGRSVLAVLSLDPEWPETAQVPAS